MSFASSSGKDEGVGHQAPQPILPLSMTPLAMPDLHVVLGHLHVHRICTHAAPSQRRSILHLLVPLTTRAACVCSRLEARRLAM